MRWRDERQSTNIEDRRGMSGGKIAIGGVGGIVLLVLALLFGADPRKLLQQLPEERGGPQTSRSVNPGDYEIIVFPEDEHTDTTFTLEITVR
jgi:uncharacterized protein